MRFIADQFHEGQGLDQAGVPAVPGKAPVALQSPEGGVAEAVPHKAPLPLSAVEAACKVFLGRLSELESCPRYRNLGADDRRNIKNAMTEAIRAFLRVSAKARY